jgi:hypothetical protein
MEDSKTSPSPFQSGVKLATTCTTLEVDATLYYQLVSSILYLTHTYYPPIIGVTKEMMS